MKVMEELPAQIQAWIYQVKTLFLKLLALRNHSEKAARIFV